MNPIMLNHLITEVQRYGRDIHDSNGENKLDPRTVEGFMTSGINPWQAISMAELTNTMKRPMIAAETFTTVLNDFTRYPYFIRANYDLQYVSMAFINVAKRNSWKYLQLVYHNDSFGEESYTVLKQIAAQEGICIVSAFALADNGTEVVMGLRNRPDVQPVVLFLMHDGFRTFMQGMKTLNASHEFQLISNLGNSKAAIQGYETYAEGMVSFEFWTGTQLSNFETYLRRLDVNTYATNPWFKEWYESTLNCSFTPVGNQTLCSGTQNMFGTSIFTYELNTNLISVIYGVIAMAQGLHETLVQYCGLRK